MARARTCSDPYSAVAAKGHNFVSAPTRGHDFDDAETAFGEGAGLVEEYSIHFRGILQYGSAAHQNASPREASHSRNHSRRRREDQSAGAGDDQDGNGAHPVPREVERQPRDQQQRGQKVTGETIRHAFHGCALFPRVFDQLDHARQSGLGSRSRYGNAQQTVAVQRSRKDFVADAFIARQRLTGDGAFVDTRIALQNDAIGRDALAPADYGDVTGYRLCRVDFDFAAIADHAGVARKLFNEAVDRGVRTAGSVAFQGFADQHDEHGFGGGQILTGE